MNTKKRTKARQRQTEHGNPYSVHILKRCSVGKPRVVLVQYWHIMGKGGGRGSMNSETVSEGVPPTLD